jgi:iron(III) transport system permease protein
MSAVTSLLAAVWDRAGQAIERTTGIDGVAKTVILGSIATVVVLLTVIPLAFLLWTSVWDGYPGQFSGTFTVENFVAVYLQDAFDIPDLVVTTLIVAVGMTLVSGVFGLTFAWLFVRTNLPTKSAMELVLISPYAVPGYIYAIMYIATYGPRNGLVSTFLEDSFGITTMPIDIFSPWGIAFVAGINGVTSFYLLTAPALQDMDPAFEEVGRIHGAGIFKTIRSVSLPLIKPAVLSAAFVTFLYGLGEFSVVAMLRSRKGVDVYSTAVWSAVNLQAPPEYGQAAALSLSLLLVTVVLVWYYRKVTARKEEFMTVRGRGYQPRKWDLGKWRWPIAIALWVVLFVIWILPILVMILASLHGQWLGQINLSELTLTHYAQALEEQRLRHAFENSVLVAVAGATIGTVIVVGLAYYTERTKGRFRGLVDFLSLTPLAVPGIIMGVSFLFAFLWFGKLHDVVDLYGTLWIIIIGSIVVFIPFSSRIAVGNIVQIHSELEESARIFGASWLQQMREIFLPLFKNTAAVLWFYLAIHIFQLLAVAMMTYTPDTVVLPVELFNFYSERANIELVSAISVLFISMAMLTVLAFRLTGITFYELGER